MPAGRNNKYSDKFPERVEEYAAKGLSDSQIAHNLGIAVSTFYDYQLKHPEFSEALKRGKRVIDEIVENSLYKSATGYEYEEIHTEFVDDKNGKPKIKSQRKIKKQMAPDTIAQIFWLKNRRPDLWRDKKDIDMGLKSKTISELFPPELSEPLKKEMD